MTYRSLVTEGGKLLQAAGVPEAELDAWYLLEYLRKEEAAVRIGSGIFFAGKKRPDWRKRKPTGNSSDAGQRGSLFSRSQESRSLWAFLFWSMNMY